MEPYALPGQIYATGLVFLRVGAVAMLMPGLGEAFVPPRIRLAFALVLSICLVPAVQPMLPAIPATLGEMGGQVLKELIIGLMLGAILRFMLLALGVAGEVVSIQTTLAFAQTANPLQAQPGGALTTFLTLLGMVLLFSANLHHLFIGAIARSYALFAPAKHVLAQDAATLAIRSMGQAFALGIQLAAPVLVFSLVFNIAAGLVARVMPQFQVFFAVAPLALLLGLSIFAVGLGGLLLIWLDRYRDFLQPFT